jgi:hypothetical protein
MFRVIFIAQPSQEFSITTIKLLTQHMGKYRCKALEKAIKAVMA